MRLKGMKIQINKTDTWTDKFFVLLIAISPILQHYKGIFVDSGALALILGLLYAIIKMLKKTKISQRSIVVVFPLLLYFLFQVIDHGTSLSELMRVVCLIVFALAFSSEAVSPKLFIRIAVSVSCIASVLIILQYICYYALGFHLQLVPASLLLNSANQWVLLAQTGRIGITGKVSNLYRPSTFFLEPAHMFLYLFPPLFYELLHPDFGSGEKRKAILISIGIILSTSGMGIVVTASVWLLHFAKRGGKDSKLSLTKLMRPRNVITIILIIVAITFLYFRVEFFQKALLRVLSSSGRESVISGRIASGNAYISSMRGRQLIFGISDSYVDEIEFHMSGFNGAIYRYGIIGTVLSYIFYVKCLFDLKDQQFWISVVILIISFFSAHTHAAFYMLYFITFLLYGYCSQNSKCEPIGKKLPDII